MVDDVWQFVINDAFGKLVAEYGGTVPGDEGGVKSYLQDWQGSVRAGVNAGGYVKSRTDHQAFGEPIESGIGLRTGTQGYGAPASNRQGYGLTENDSATGLNHTWFRKNENRAGRWTSPDPYNGSASVGNPQSWNRYSYVENQPTNFVDPSGLNAIGGFYVCYDIVTTGGYPNQPGHVYTTTETVCFVFGGGNPGVGTIDTGGGIGGGIGGAAGPKDDRDECYKKVEADYSKPPSASSEEIHRFTAQMNAVEATHKLALDGATIKASNTLYYAVLAAAGGFMAGALFTKNVWGAAVGAVVAGGFTLATQATDIQLSRDQAWKAYKIATGLARTLNPNAAKRERFFDQKRAALRKCDSLYPPNRFWKITSPLNA